MIDNEKRRSQLEKKARVRRRMNAKVDPENYEYIPAKKQIDYYDNETNQRVGIYVRVSTTDVRQTTSYELQKKYYEDFVCRHPNWTLVNIYADEGISGTSLKKRDAFNQMIADAKAGKIDLIVTKSVSRFARNVMICIGMVRDLAEMKPPVGVFFESECIFSLNDDSQMALSFQATMAEEESHTRSRSMETSLRMRLDNGIPLTPKLLGFSHDMDGNLVINPEEAPTVKLIFYMYLYGYSTQQIADALIALGRKSYLGNLRWTSTTVVQILRNERHCGDVLTRKTFTENYRSHRTLKNRGEKPQSRYTNHHEAIVSRDDFIAVQQMLTNAKYGNRSVLPELRVIDSGVLTGFVVINPRWAGFKEPEYYQASRSVYPPETEEIAAPGEYQIEMEPGDFDFRGFEITRSAFFDAQRKPAVLFEKNKLKFTAACTQKFGDKNFVELLINPVTQQFAVRPSKASNRCAVQFSIKGANSYRPRMIAAAAFSPTLFSLFGWNENYKYRIIGSLFEKDGECAYIFDAENAEAYFRSYILSEQDSASVGNRIHPLTPSGKHIRAIPEEWTANFGKQFYLHDRSLAELEAQNEDDWQLYLCGQLVETSHKLHVTDFETLRSYIKQELGSLTYQEE